MTRYEQIDHFALTVEAAVLLRGDLNELRPDGHEALDSELAEAIALGDRSLERAAKALAGFVANEPDLGARLRALRRGLESGEFSAFGATTVRDVYTSLAGTPVYVKPTIWTCPLTPPVHYRKIQRAAHQAMGQCPTHCCPLIREEASS